MYNTPLTQEQSDFTAKHHNLIYSFLNQHRYPEDEYYDVAALGLISAVKAYFTHEHLRAYAFSTIAYSRMSGYTWRYRKAEIERNKRMVSYDEYAGLAPIDYDSPENLIVLNEYLESISEGGQLIELYPDLVA